MDHSSEGDGEDLAVVDGETVLLGTRCRDCGRHFFPRRSRCTACGSRETKRIRFDRVVSLETYAVVHVPPPGFDAPYPVGFARLSPGSVRAFGPIDDSPTKLEIGRALVPTRLDPEITFVPEPIWGFEFRENE